MEDKQYPTFKFHYEFREGEIRVFLEGFEVMRMMFYPDSYSNAIFEKLKQGNAFIMVSEEDRRGMYALVRERLAEKGVKASDEGITALEDMAIRSVELDLIKKSVEKAVKLVSDNLINVVQMVWEKLLQATFFSGANELRDILEAPEQKYSAKEIKEGIFRADWERLKPLVGVTHGGARPRKAKFVWDAEKALTFYQTVEALPRHRADKLTMWEYAREVLRDNDYDHETIQFLMARPMFSDVPEELMKEAAKVWRQYDERWDSLPPANSPLAFAFRHACHKLDYPEYAFNTLRTKYYEGKKAAETKG
jgi:hypothetical protein